MKKMLQAAALCGIVASCSSCHSPNTNIPVVEGKIVKLGDFYFTHEAYVTFRQRSDNINPLGLVSQKRYDTLAEFFGPLFLHQENPEKETVHNGKKVIQEYQVHTVFNAFRDALYGENKTPIEYIQQ